VQRVPVVLATDEASHIIDRLSATLQLYTQLKYGSGLGVGEVLGLYTEPKAANRICRMAVSERYLLRQGGCLSVQCVGNKIA
jgi:hypothetical protein